VVLAALARMQLQQQSIDISSEPAAGGLLL